MPGKMHNELTRRALRWLSNRCTGKGIRCNPEVFIAPGYVADGAALMNFQFRFLQILFKGKDSEVVPEDFTVIIESKASRSDFQNTFVRNNHGGDRLIPMANLHFLVTAKGVITAASEVPSFWGHLEESRNGLALIKWPTYCVMPVESLHHMAYRILTSDNRKLLIMGLDEQFEETEQQPTLDLVFNHGKKDNPLRSKTGA